MKNKIEELIAVAKKATPGPWAFDKQLKEIFSDVNGRVFIANARLTDTKDLIQKRNDGIYIATFHPAFVLKLLESWLEMRSCLQPFSGRDGYEDVNSVIAKADKLFL